VETTPGYRGFLRLCEAVGLDLEPFQRKIAHAAHGDQHELLALLPRGCGKSRLVGTLAVHHLLTVPRAAVYIAAASREQASIVFRYARDVAQHPAIAERLIVRHLELRGPDGAFLKVLASDAPKLLGLSPTLCVVDELCAHKDEQVYVALRSALHKVPGARMVTISTAGQGAESPLGRLRSRALAQPEVTRRGALTDARGPSLRMLDWSAPESADVDDPEQVKRAIPASWIGLDAIRDQRAALPDLAFRRYVANQWTAREGAWLPPGAWQACVGEPRFEDGERVWVGVDVGGSESASAVCWVNADLSVGVSIFHGDEGVLECVAQVRELAGRYRVEEVVFDPWRFGQAAQELERERVRVVQFPQTDVRMIPASGRLHRAIVERRVTLPPSRELAEHAAAAIARHSRRGWRIDKAARSDSIDAIIALTMAVERAEARPEPARVLGWV